MVFIRAAENNLGWPWTSDHSFSHLPSAEIIECCHHEWFTWYWGLKSELPAFKASQTGCRLILRYTWEPKELLRSSHLCVWSMCRPAEQAFSWPHCHQDGYSPWELKKTFKELVETVSLWNKEIGLIVKNTLSILFKSKLLCKDIAS